MILKFSNQDVRIFVDENKLYQKSTIYVHQQIWIDACLLNMKIPPANKKKFSSCKKFLFYYSICQTTHEKQKKICKKFSCVA
jgi:hypothetical protein